MKKIIIATNNAGKIQEMQDILAPIHCVPQQELAINDVPEIGLSFIENALIKARHASHIAHQPALADDSGLVVPALHGAPGIYSRRFAGPDATDQENMNLLLDKLKGLDEADRIAFFYCAIVFVEHAEDPIPLFATGTVVGRINHEPKGNNGFGYDPLFYLPDYNCTIAELSKVIKNKISHRAQALTELKAKLDTSHLEY